MGRRGERIWSAICRIPKNAAMVMVEKVQRQRRTGQELTEIEEYRK